MRIEEVRAMVNPTPPPMGQVNKGEQGREQETHNMYLFHYRKESVNVIKHWPFIGFWYMMLSM